MVFTQLQPFISFFLLVFCFGGFIGGFFGGWGVGGGRVGGLLFFERGGGG